MACGDLFELAQAGSDWIWETDAELRFSWLSENYEQATGVAAEKVLGRFRFDFLKQGPNGSKTRRGASRRSPVQAAVSRLRL